MDGSQKAIFLICCPNDHKKSGLIHVGFGNFEFQRPEFGIIREENVCFCDIGVFERRDRKVGGCKSYFSDTY